MRRMLDPKEAGGSLPSSITFDEAGNRTVGKDLGVDGKLKLKSLVSASNPDGDITKELGGGGGGKIYLHSITLVSSEYSLCINIYSTSNTKLTFEAFEQLVRHYGNITCNGFYKMSTTSGIAINVAFNTAIDRVIVLYFDLQNKTQDYSVIKSSSFEDDVAEIL